MENVTNDISKIEVETIHKACELLSSYNVRIGEYLGHYVSSLCDVDYHDLMYDTKHLNVAKARWLFWYAYRHMTNDSFDSISKMTSRYRKFATSCVGCSCAKMARMIDFEPVWAKRWDILKRIIKTILNTNTQHQGQNNIIIKVVHPKNVKVELKQE